MVAHDTTLAKGSWGLTNENRYISQSVKFSRSQRDRFALEKTLKAGWIGRFRNYVPLSRRG